MKMKIFILSLLVLAGSISAFAHAVLVEFNQHAPVVVVRAGFSKSSAMKNASIEVFAPVSGALYQTGQTDASGRFAFLPDVEGEWSVKVDDGRGHRKTASITIDASFFESKPAIATEVSERSEVKEIEIKEVKTESIPLLYRLIFGLAVIFGITGIVYGLKASRR